MAKAVALIVLALGVLAMAGHAQGYIPNPYYVDPTSKTWVAGDVTCATCIANSEPDIEILQKWNMIRPELKAMTPDPIAVVELICKSRKTGAVTVKVPGYVDVVGSFRIYVEYGHEDDLCTVSVVNSSHPLCNVKVPGYSSTSFTFNKNDNYLIRYGTNESDYSAYITRPFGFVNKKFLPDCPKVPGKGGNMIPAVVLPQGQT